MKIAAFPMIATVTWLATTLLGIWVVLDYANAPENAGSSPAAPAGRASNAVIGRELVEGTPRGK